MSGSPSFSYTFPAATRKGYKVCELKLVWPEARLFVGEGKSKQTAKISAALQALEWLYLNNHISKDCTIFSSQSFDSSKSSLRTSSIEADSSFDVGKRTASERFPRPLHTLDIFRSKLESKLGEKIDDILKFSLREIKGQRDRKICDLVLSWPETLQFSGKGISKKAAKTSAVIQALEWLYENNHIDEDGRILSFKNIAESKNEILVDFSESALTKIDSVLNTFSGEIMPALSSCNQEENITEAKEEGNLIHPTLGVPFPKSEDLSMWSEVLASSFKESHRKALPVDQHRQEILDIIQANRVVILKGETGCGKTTRVPQFILEEAITNGHGADCNIAVAQPRRLTAVETAKYVAMERGENIGKSVGYSVKMATVLPSVVGGSITFMTGLKLALKFGTNSSLEGVSHVILDEVHMRDIGTDLLMYLLKQNMQINGNLRLIIMSATVNTNVFQSYFDCFGNVPVIEIPGRTFPVKMHFLNDLPSHLVPKQNSKRKMQEEDYDEHEEKVTAEVDLHLTRNVVSWINEEKPDGGILVFVSGWKDMAELQKLLWEEKNLLIIPVHSMFRDCSAAFRPAPHGMRKVILATNIAETSLTFPDIVYVVDCGIHKKPQRKFLSPGGWSTSELSLDLVTKANVLQRKGRAGRVQPGESFHLFSKEVFDRMDNYELPGILCESLEYLILTVKLVNPSIKAEDLLKRFPTPPSTRDVRQAVNTLKEVSLLTRENERPTALASAIMHISSSLPSALALIYSAIFRCFDRTCSIIACEEAQLQLGSREETSGSIQRSLKEPYHISSDHLAKSSILCLDHMHSKPHPSYIQAKRLREFLRKQILSHRTGFSSSNLNENNSEKFVLGVLLYCYGSLLIRHHSSNLNHLVREKSGVTAVIRSRSVNHKSPDPFAMYLSGHMTGENCLFVSDTSIVSPLSVLLFLPTLFKTQCTDSGTAVVQVGRGTRVRIAMPWEHYERILGLRRALTDVREYFVVAEALNRRDDNYDQLCQFRTQLTECINGILKIEAR